eukprot:TRINITY_DN12531_c0_g1_i1.p1 TRINITY_DN12531_c0_g1~~TRINITY_DN12531_c0_g1_i1.p1  ORF type:complete len:259 (-),score=34.23 TRINITY_DN12531_c0_g1_i1:35-811(-)
MASSWSEIFQSRDEFVISFEKHPTPTKGIAGVVTFFLGAMGCIYAVLVFLLNLWVSLYVCDSAGCSIGVFFSLGLVLLVLTVGFLMIFPTAPLAMIWAGVKILYHPPKKDPKHRATFTAANVALFTLAGLMCASTVFLFWIIMSFSSLCRHISSDSSDSDSAFEADACILGVSLTAVTVLMMCYAVPILLFAGWVWYRTIKKADTPPVTTGPVPGLPREQEKDDEENSDDEDETVNAADSDGTYHSDDSDPSTDETVG